MVCFRTFVSVVFVLMYCAVTCNCHYNVQYCLLSCAFCDLFLVVFVLLYMVCFRDFVSVVFVLFS